MTKKRLIILTFALLAGIAVGGLAVYKWKHEKRPFAETLHPSSAPADDGMQAALAALADGNSGEAISVLADLANNGNHAAQTMLGTIYLEGKIVKRDGKKAVKWFKKAAADNYLPAMVTLGKMFQSGESVKQNLNKAAGFFERAAEAGDSDAKLALASIYINTEEPNSESGRKGQKLLQDLARAGQVEAMLMLAAHALQRGKDREACDWFLKAASKGSSDGAVGIGQCFQIGKGRKQNKVEFLRWTMTAAESDNPNAQYQMGRAYLHGISTSKDEQEASLWFDKAANLGHLEAQYTLGVLFAKGVGVEQNLEMAVQWLDEAKKSGHKQAEEFVGKMSEAEYLKSFDISILESHPHEDISH